MNSGNRNVNGGNGRVLVVDTCVFIKDPDIFYKVGNDEIVVPGAVIKELDGLKRHPDPEDPKARAARRVSRILDELGSRQDIAKGARTSAGSTVRIFTSYKKIDDLASNADNRIVGAALELREKTGKDIVLVSMDGNMRNVARGYSITAANYPFKTVSSHRRAQVQPSVGRSAERSINRRAAPLSGNKRYALSGIPRALFVVIAIFFVLLLISR